MRNVLLSDAIAALLEPSRLAVAGSIVDRPAGLDHIVERAVVSGQ